MDKNFVSRFLKGSLSASTGTIATVVFHFLSITVMTRVVEPETLGLYFLILATAMFFKILSSLGLDLTLVKFLSNEDEADKQEATAVILLTRMVVLLIISVLVYLAGELILPLLGHGLEPYVVLIPFLFAGHSIRELLLYLMQGLQQFKNYALVQVISAVFKFVLIFIFLRRLDLLTLLYIELAMLALSIVVQSWMIPFRKLGLFDLKFNLATLRRVITFGFPLYYTSLLVVGYDKSSVFLINYFLDPLSIALYEVALKIPEGFMRIFRSFITVYFPNLATLFSQNKRREALTVMNKSLGLFSLGITTLCVGSYLFGREIVTLVFSAQYASVDLAFALLMLGVYLRVIANILGYALVSAGLPSTSSKVNTISVVVYFATSLFFIPRVGYIGAAHAFLAMNTVAIVAYYLYLRSESIAPNMIAFLRPSLIGLGVALAFAFVGGQSFLLKVLFMLIFVGLTAVFVPDFRDAMRYSSILLAKISQKLPWQAKPVS